MTCCGVIVKVVEIPQMNNGLMKIIKHLLFFNLFISQGISFSLSLSSSQYYFQWNFKARRHIAGAEAEMKTAFEKFISKSGAFMVELVKIMIAVTHLLRP